jgi:glycosyltransferase involved in cell wall biosynthesis
VARRPIRVTFIIGSLDIGGAERQLVRLVNNLDQARFAPSIISWFGGGSVAAELRPGVPVVHLELERVARARPLLRPLLGARLLLRLMAAIRTQRPDVVNAYMFSAYVLGSIAARLSGVPAIVASRRGLISYRTYPTRWHWLARLANRVIDLHICNSEAVRRWAVEKEGIPEARLAVVHNGLDIPPHTPIGEDGQPGPWHRPATVSAAMIANFHTYKGHLVLLDALAEVVRSHPDFTVVLLGDGDQRAALEARARQLGVERNLVFAGARLDAAGLLPEFDFSILTSFEEGFPNAVMESMAAGVPVVASAVGGIPELVTEGVEGRLVPVRDPHALAAAITWMIENPEARRAMGAVGRRRIQEQFSVERMVSRTEDRRSQRLARRAPARRPTAAGA